MGKVVPLDASQDPQTLLEAAKQWGLTDVVIVGYDQNGDLTCGASKGLTCAQTLWLLEQMKLFLFQATIDE